MSELFSMLIPLQGSYPGWPVAPQRSILDILLVLVVIPVAIGAVIGLIAMGGALARRGRGGSPRQKDPVWIGRTTSAKAITADAGASENGGASVRW